MQARDALATDGVYQTCLRIVDKQRLKSGRQSAREARKMKVTVANMLSISNVPEPLCQSQSLAVAPDSKAVEPNEDHLLDV